MTRDLVPGGWRPGGAALYAALTAVALGWRVGVVTSAADPALLAQRAGLVVHCRPAAATTTFTNLYLPERRVQRCDAVAAALGPAEVPAAWRMSARAVLLAPVMNEVDPALVDCFPQARVAVAAQGYLRRRLRDGTVVGRRWQPPRRWLARLAAVVVSSEDIAHQPEVRSLLTAAPVLVVTQGAAGAEVVCGGATAHVPAFPTRAVDPTGAGDVFAAALLLALCEGQAPLEAVRFAACAASWAVEAPGVMSIPTREQVEERLRQWGVSAP